MQMLRDLMFDPKDAVSGLLIVCFAMGLVVVLYVPVFIISWLTGLDRGAVGICYIAVLVVAVWVGSAWERSR
ncbi:hypothetical protein [Paenirhodobacter enshiensis]|uniref:hypothetical protein n=1 Tax=Paenirhodobacter enshiensis TaxID=1105367 RepID=UPI0035B22FE2